MVGVGDGEMLDAEEDVFAGVIVAARITGIAIVVVFAVAMEVDDGKELGSRQLFEPQVPVLEHQKRPK